MSNHIGLKFIASIGTIIQGEVKSKTRGIHHHYRKLIQELIDTYEGQCNVLRKNLETVSNKKLKYIVPLIPLPRGVVLPEKSYLSRESLFDQNSDEMKPLEFIPQIALVDPAVVRSCASENKIVPITILQREKAHAKSVEIPVSAKPENGKITISSKSEEVLESPIGSSRVDIKSREKPVNSTNEDAYKHGMISVTGIKNTVKRKCPVETKPIEKKCLLLSQRNVEVRLKTSGLPAVINENSKSADGKPANMRKPFQLRNRNDHRKMNNPL